MNIPHSSLVDLDLRRCHLGDVGALIFATALAGNSVLKKLNVSCNSDITIRGWRAILASIFMPQSSLENLLLWENSINDATSNLLANALANNSQLNALSLSSIYYISAEGWRALFGASQNPRCMLQDLLSANRLCDGLVAHLANSLAGSNCVLSRLYLGYCPEGTAVG